MNQNIKAIFFDLDDTLLNCRKAQHIAILEFKRLHSEFDKFSNDEFAESWRKASSEIYDKYHYKEITFEELKSGRMQNLYKNFDIKISFEKGSELFKEYHKLYEKNWCLFDDTIEVISNLKDNYKIAIITNGDSIQQRNKIKKVELDKYFDNIFISTEVGFAKPHKEIFDYACEKIGEVPENCIMVGDLYKSDIQGSINSGIQGIWLNRSNDDKEYEFQIKELSEIFKYL